MLYEEICCISKYVAYINMWYKKGYPYEGVTSCHTHEEVTLRVAQAGGCIKKSTV